jgi:tetratricopeptide (TPR) repeat protein
VAILVSVEQMTKMLLAKDHQVIDAVPPDRSQGACCPWRRTTARLEEAVAAYGNALKEWTRGRVPLDWAMNQNNLGTALWRLGEEETNTARLEEAITAFRGSLQVFETEGASYYLQAVRGNIAVAKKLLTERRMESWGPAWWICCAGSK